MLTRKTRQNAEGQKSRITRSFSVLFRLLTRAAGHRVIFRRILPVAAFFHPAMIEGFSHIASHVNSHPEHGRRDRMRNSFGGCVGLAYLPEIQEEPVDENWRLCR